MAACKCLKNVNQELLVKYCILCMFAIPVIVSIAFLVGIGIQSLITGTWSFRLSKIAALIINAAGFVCTMSLYLKMFSKDLGLSKKAKTGLLLMTICAVLGYVGGIFSEQILKNKDIFMICSMVMAFRDVVYIVALWIFISGCKVEKKLERFIKATPFISFFAVGFFALMFAVVNADWISSVQYLVCDYLLKAVYLVVVFFLSGGRKGLGLA